MNTTSRPMMDRRLKERLVGATILVALIVLVVPELLSGPKHPGAPPAAGLAAAPTRTVSVDLSTNRATAEPDAAAASQAAPAAAASSTPDASASRRAGERSATGATGANGAGSTTGAPPVEGGEPAPASAPSVATLGAQTGVQPPLETPAATPKSSTANQPAARPADITPAPQRVWAVQLGSFASKSNALRLAHQLQASGGSFYVAPGGSGSALRYRVRMGPLADRAAAERALAKLKAQGHPATIVTPAS